MPTALRNSGEKLKRMGKKLTSWKKKSQKNLPKTKQKKIKAGVGDHT